MSFIAFASWPVTNAKCKYRQQLDSQGRPGIEVHIQPTVRVQQCKVFIRSGDSRLSLLTEAKNLRQESISRMVDAW